MSLVITMLCGFAQGCGDSDNCPTCTLPVDAGAFWNEGVFTKPAFGPELGVDAQKDATAAGDH